MLNRPVMPPQPLRVYFKFTAPKSTADSMGKVEVVLTVANELFGPFPTEIQAPVVVWQNRRVTEPSPTAKALNQPIQALTDRLVSAWAVLLPLNEPITGDMILKKAGLSHE